MVPLVAFVLFVIVATVIATIKRKISIVEFVCIAFIYFLIVLCLVVYAHIFVPPPTEIISEGRTLIISRLHYFKDNTGFIDSVDVVSKRTKGNVSPFFQQVISQTVFESTKVYVRLPCSRFGVVR
jgi:predicted PurR-regulated permease PerM